MAFKNVIDNSSTSVSASTPGWTVDLTNHTTARLRNQGVPVRFKVCVNSTAGNDTGALKLVDSGGNAVLTCLINNPAATSSAIGDWYWVDGYVPATLAKYDVHYGGNTLGTLTPFSASLYEIDWTTDTITGSASMTLGAMTVSAYVPFSGDLSATLGAVTVASTGTVDVIGTASQTLGALTVGSTGTVATSSPPSFQAAGTAVSGADGANATPSWPTHATDDIALLLIVQVGTGGTDPGAATLNTANGFAAVTGGSVLSSFSTLRIRTTVFWCRATSGSMSAPVVKGIAGFTTRTVIVSARGAATSGNPWNVVSTSKNDGFDTSLVATGATTTAANTLVFALVGVDVIDAGVAGTASGWTNADLTSITERVDSEDAAAGGVHVASGTKATAGAYGNTTATFTQSETWAAVTVALKP